MKIKVEGLKELDAALGELKKATAKRVVRKALLEAATPMQEQAERMAPTREDMQRMIKFGPKEARQIRLPGTTRALVQIGTGLTRRQASTARKETKFFTQVYVGTRDRVARLLESGTVFVAAHPFLAPAYDMERVRTAHRFRGALRVEIKRTADRAAKRAVKLKR